MVPVLPGQGAIFGSLNSDLKPRHPLHFVGLLGERLGAVVRGDNVRVVLAIDGSENGQRRLPIGISGHVPILAADDEVFSVHEDIGAGFQFR